MKNKYQHILRMGGSVMVYSDKPHPTKEELVDLYYDSVIYHDDFDVIGFVATYRVDEDYNQVEYIERKTLKPSF